MRSTICSPLFSVAALCALAPQAQALELYKGG